MKKNENINFFVLYLLFYLPSNKSRLGNRISWAYLKEKKDFVIRKCENNGCTPISSLGLA